MKLTPHHDIYTDALAPGGPGRWLALDKKKIRTTGARPSVVVDLCRACRSHESRAFASITFRDPHSAGAGSAQDAIWLGAVLYYPSFAREGFAREGTELRTDARDRGYLCHVMSVPLHVDDTDTLDQMPALVTNATLFDSMLPLPPRERLGAYIAQRALRAPLPRWDRNDRAFPERPRAAAHLARFLDIAHDAHELIRPDGAIETLSLDVCDHATAAIEMSRLLCVLPPRLRVGLTWCAGLELPAGAPFRVQVEAATPHRSGGSLAVQPPRGPLARRYYEWLATADAAERGRVATDWGIRSWSDLVDATASAAAAPRRLRLWWSESSASADVAGVEADAAPRVAAPVRPVERSEPSPPRSVAPLAPASPHVLSTEDAEAPAAGAPVAPAAEASRPSRPRPAPAPGAAPLPPEPESAATVGQLAALVSQEREALARSLEEYLERRLVALVAAQVPAEPSLRRGLGQRLLAMRTEIYFAALLVAVLWAGRGGALLPASGPESLPQVAAARPVSPLTDALTPESGARLPDGTSSELDPGDKGVASSEPEGGAIPNAVDAAVAVLPDPGARPVALPDPPYDADWEAEWSLRVQKAPEHIARWLDVMLGTPDAMSDLQRERFVKLRSAMDPRREDEWLDGLYHYALLYSGEVPKGARGTTRVNLVLTGIEQPALWSVLRKLDLLRAFAPPATAEDADRALRAAVVIRFFRALEGA
jgi:hypothetical protein